MTIQPRDINVVDRQSFIAFLDALHSNFISSANKDVWENPTLDRFLEAMTAYANDIQGYYNNTGQGINADIPSWKVFADILLGATIYE
jgi:hypothetical protein